MTDWRIILSLVIVAVIAFSILESKVLSAVRLRRLKVANRFIDAERAIEEHEAGRGKLVRNKSSLPGEWWYLDDTDRPSDYDLVMSMREFGRVLNFKSRRVRQQMKRYKGKVEEMLEPFED